MNRSALNSSVVGSGSRLPLSFVAATQALYLVVSMAGRVIRYGKIDQPVTINGVTHTRVTRFFEAVEVMALNYSANCRIWVKVYGKIVQNFALGYTSTTRRFAVMKASVGMTLVPSLRSWATRRGKAVQTLALSGVTTIRTALRATATRAMSLIGSLTAFDVTTTPANAERTAVVENTSRTVIVPGESFDAGV